MTLFQHRYRIESTRFSGKDYTTRGMYFVTICTKGRIPWFGEIRRGIMGLSDIGCIVTREIEQTMIIRPYVRMDTWIVMPDHVHILMEIIARCDAYDIVETARRAVSTNVAMTIPIPRLQPGCIGAIIGRIKAMSTQRIRHAGHNDFSWQPRFHDRIVRSDRALVNVRRYIAENPKQWGR